MFTLQMWHWRMRFSMNCYKPRVSLILFTHYSDYLELALVLHGLLFENQFVCDVKWLRGVCVCV